MNKKDLIAQLAKESGTTKVAATKTIDLVFGSVKNSLENGESVLIRGFGSFTIRKRLERKGVNPITKKPIKIKSKKVVKFSASKEIVVK